MTMINILHLETRGPRVTSSGKSRIVFILIFVFSLWYIIEFTYTVYSEGVQAIKPHSAE